MTNDSKKIKLQSQGIDSKKEFQNTAGYSLPERQTMDESLACAEPYLEMAGIMILALDSNGVIQSANRVCCKVLNYPEEKLIGLNWFDEFVHPQDKEKIKKIIDLLLKGKKQAKRHSEYRLKTAKGEKKTVFWTNIVLTNDNGEPTGILGTGTDITEQKKFQEKLARKAEKMALANEELLNLKNILVKSRNKLSAVFDSLNDIIISVTPDGIIESLNLAAAQRAEMHPSQLVGLSARKYLAKARMATNVSKALLASFDKMEQSGACEYKVIETNGHDGPLYYEITTVPVFDAQGDFSLGIIHLKDVTLLKRMENKVRQANEILEQEVRARTEELTQAKDALQAERDRLIDANKELVRLDKLRQNLTNMVVHDLKGPLSEIMGNLDLMSYGTNLDETQKEARDLAATGTDDLLRMIMNLLDISRMEEGSLKIKPGKVDFLTLSNAVLSKFITTVRLRDIKVDLVDGGNPSFEADKDLLERVIQNLFTNALNHTPEGGKITLWAESDPANKGVTIHVKDSGCGIPKKFHNQIFKKFTQVDPNAGPRTSTGLGLNFCLMAVNSHGGRIWFDSDEGRGACFHFWIPEKLPEKSL